MKHVYMNTDVNLKENIKHLRCNVATKSMSIQANPIEGFDIKCYSKVSIQLNDNNDCCAQPFVLLEWPPSQERST